MTSRGTPPEALFVPSLPARHAFFTRRGGLSSGPYASLNCSISSGDDPDTVRANRARAAQSLALESARLVGLHQVHGCIVVKVTEPWPPGAGPPGDAMVTDRPGVALGIVTADCAPILFVDPDAGVVGAAHAGWRGAIGGVIEATVSAMVAEGARRPAIRGAVGPCIGADSYEVGLELRSAAIEHDPTHDRFFRAGRHDRWFFDLAGYCAARLKAACIGSVEVAAADTCADEERFFSHRRRMRAGGGPIGHQLSLIALAG
jgi:YfiH family protein